MNIVDKAKGLYDSHKDQIQDGINKGKDLVNKAMSGRHSAQATALAQEAQDTVADAGASSPGVSSPGASSSGTASSGTASSGTASAGATAADTASPVAGSPDGTPTEAGTEAPATPTAEA
jgi:hypothetical protein